jgi:hypothetical protein
MSFSFCLLLCLFIYDLPSLASQGSGDCYNYALRIYIYASVEIAMKRERVKALEPANPT